MTGAPKNFGSRQDDTKFDLAAVCVLIPILGRGLNSLFVQQNQPKKRARAPCLGNNARRHDMKKRHQKDRTLDEWSSGRLECSDHHTNIWAWGFYWQGCLLAGWRRTEPNQDYLLLGLLRQAPHLYCRVCTWSRWVQGLLPSTTQALQS